MSLLDGGSLGKGIGFIAPQRWRFGTMRPPKSRQHVLYELGTAVFIEYSRINEVLLDGMPHERVQ